MESIDLPPSSHSPDNYGRLSPSLPGVREIDSPVVGFRHNLFNRRRYNDANSAGTQLHDIVHILDNAGTQAQVTAPAASIGHEAVDVSFSFAAERRSKRSRDGVSLQLSDSPSSVLLSYQSDNSSELETLVGTNAPT